MRRDVEPRRLRGQAEHRVNVSLLLCVRGVGPVLAFLGGGACLRGVLARGYEVVYIGTRSWRRS